MDLNCQLHENMNNCKELSLAQNQILTHQLERHLSKLIGTLAMIFADETIYGLTTLGASMKQFDTAEDSYDTSLVSAKLLESCSFETAGYEYRHDKTAV